METCYKVFRKELLHNIVLRSNDFAIEPEITAKLLKQNVKILELPISYEGRSYEKGKKITWKDGLIALFTLFKYRWFD